MAMKLPSFVDVILIQTCYVLIILRIQSNFVRYTSMAAINFGCCGRGSVHFYGRSWQRCCGRGHMCCSTTREVPWRWRSRAQSEWLVVQLLRKRIIRGSPWSPFAFFVYLVQHCSPHPTVFEGEQFAQDAGHFAGRWRAVRKHVLRLADVRWLVSRRQAIAVQDKAVFIRCYHSLCSI